MCLLAEASSGQFLLLAEMSGWDVLFRDSGVLCRVVDPAVISREHVAVLAGFELLFGDLGAVEVLVGADAGVFLVVFGREFRLVLKIPVGAQLHVVLAEEVAGPVVFRTLGVITTRGLLR